ncbi:hypothetical protein D3C71_2142880 [compost metagenome]
MLVGVVVVAEREGVARMEPAVVGVAAVLGLADVEHGVFLSMSVDEFHTGLLS